MPDLYKNKYRIPSVRLQTWDYASNGLYFVTICIKDKEYLFGNIVETQCIASPADRLNNIASPTDSMDDILQLTDFGKIVEQEWLKTPELRPDMNLNLNEYVVMPNHFHGIIYVGENSYNEPYFRDEIRLGDATHCVSTSSVDDLDAAKNKFGPQYKNLSSIIRGFKSSVTTYARKNEIPFNWQPRFHDHIIRSHDEYLRIANYIVNNPLNWQADKFYK